jgi:hypothetical protein
MESLMELCMVKKSPIDMQFHKKFQKVWVMDVQFYWKILGGLRNGDGIANKCDFVKNVL